MKKLKILFLDPPVSSKSGSVEVREFILHKKYPLGILSIMTYVKNEIPDCDIKYLKVLCVEKEKDYLPQVKEFAPSIVGFPCYSYDFYQTYQLIRRIKSILPESHICCGGPHVNFFPKETLRLPEIDSVVIGDGEEPFLNLCHHLTEGEPLNIVGIYTKKDLEGNKAFIPFLNEDLNKLPIPDIKLIDNYLSYVSFLSHKPLATIVSSKGCPFVCNYCSSKSAKYRQFKIERVVETMSYYHSLGVQEFEFWDETFNPNIKKLNDFANELRQKRLPIIFALRGTVVQHVDYDSLKNLKEVGLRRIQFGVETTSERLLKIINKNIDKKKIAKAFSICNKLKISSVANMMIGLPTQTESEIVEDFKFIKECRPTYISVSIFNYAPNTEFYGDYLKAKPDEDYWRVFAKNPQEDVILRHCEDIISRERLYYLQRLWTRKHYLRPSYLLKYPFSVPKDELFASVRVGLKLIFN